MNFRSIVRTAVALVGAAALIASATLSSSASGIPLDGSRILSNAPLGTNAPFNPHTQAGNPSGNDVGNLAATRYVTVETSMLVGTAITNVPFSINGKTYTVPMVAGHSKTIDLGSNDGFSHWVSLNPYSSNATALVFTLRANDGELLYGR